MKFDSIRRGTVLTQFIGADGAMWDMSSNGVTLIVAATSQKCKTFQMGGKYEFRCSIFDDVMFFSIKIGDADWIDAPYTPHLSQNFEPEEFPQGMGMILSVFIVASETGTVLDIDFMSLLNDFSNKINAHALAILQKDFNQNANTNTINKVYSSMTPKQLAESATICCSLN